MLRRVLILTAALTAWSANASNNHAWPWDIASVSLEQVQDDTIASPLVTNDCSKIGINSLEDGTIGWDQIITIGEKIWKIIEAGKPVVTTTTPVVSALPRGVECWSDLEM